MSITLDEIQRTSWRGNNTDAPYPGCTDLGALDREVLTGPDCTQFELQIALGCYIGPYGLDADHPTDP